jgi:hypothetical protein
MQIWEGWEIFEKCGNSDPFILAGENCRIGADWLSDARGACDTATENNRIFQLATPTV